ncbi:MAG: FGGY family carbohydrate kinase, partial [Phycisphaerales bacterium]|nr:FGGY family carbohydrate kinase [Phycisphaerales bacterium]
MNAKHYIAVDLGAESGRVMLGTVSEARIELVEIHRFLNLPVQVLTSSPRGSLHWNILELWREIKTGINKAVAAANVGGRGGTIAGIGVDTWGVDFAMLDKNLQLLSNPVSYRDPRTVGIAESVFAKIPRDKLYRITGIQTLPINTLFQLASLAGPPPSAQLAAATHILFLPDLLTFWLSGKLGTEYTIASTSQMLDATSRQFSPEVLRAIGIDPSLFPPIDFPGKPTSIRGTVLPSANETLAAAGTPVIAVGSHDTASAVAAVPAQASDEGGGGGGLFFPWGHGAGVAAGDNPPGHTNPPTDAKTPKKAPPS